MWFLSSEDGEPLGQVYRGADDAVPVLGETLTGGRSWESATVLGSEELATACSIRRFKVTVRVVSPDGGRLGEPHRPGHGEV